MKTDPDCCVEDEIGVCYARRLGHGHVGVGHTGRKRQRGNGTIPLIRERPLKPTVKETRIL